MRYCYFDILYDKWDKQSKEIQAESTAFWVAGMLGLDTGDYSFG